jgi:hypothetical protein
MYGFQKRPHQAPPAAPPDDASARGFRPPVRRDLDRAENESTRGGAGLGFRAGGLVRGPGTGTSDSVKTSVPEGTYIMPADSTQQIGPEALSAVGFRPGSKPKAPNIPGMGFGPTAQVPVNLSNGEFRLSPEQVHAIGVQVLEGMKAATHTPAGEQGDNDGDDASTRELFFADGGLVEDPNKMRPLATSPTNTYPGNQAERAGNIYAQSNADMSTRIGDASRAVPGASLLADGSQTRMVAGQIGNAWNENADKGNYAKAAGATLRGTAAMIPAAMEDSMNTTARRMQPAVEFGKGLFGIEDAKPTPAQATTPAPAAPAPTTPAATAANPDTKPVTDPAKSYMDAGPVPYTVTPVENTNGVQRINQPGKSPLFTNIDPGQAVAEMKGNPVGGFRPASMRGDAAGAAPSGPGLGFQPNGIGGPDVMGILQRENQIRAGMTSLRDEIAFNGGNGIGFRQRTPDEAVRELLFSNKAASRIAALNHMNGRQEAADQQENDQRQLAMKVQDSLNRQGIANEELGLKREAQGFQTRAARRQEELQARYEAAKTPEERSAIAQQIRDLSGREPPRADSEMVKARMNLIAELGKQYGASQPIADGKPVPFETWAEPMLRAAGLGQAAEPAAIKAGEVRKGYRFKGGNPADQASWEKV